VAGLFVMCSGCVAHFGNHKTVPLTALFTVLYAVFSSVVTV